ncbi:MAG TPA: hypothetical protein VHQ47_02830 [Phycisphaerae bacterium]|jgi:hypothetical protein|nr:hypothetical protein [Phycisphaerae bacterium]HVX83750.1 hypothetical protein [Phycisphaerae bacterium]
MPRNPSIRARLSQLVNAVPFRRFVLILESGDRLLIEHPENIAFDPTDGRKAQDDLLILTRRTVVISTIDAVTGIAFDDRQNAAA